MFSNLLLLYHCKNWLCTRLVTLLYGLAIWSLYVSAFPVVNSSLGSKRIQFEHKFDSKQLQNIAGIAGVKMHTGREQSDCTLSTCYL